jgi:Na+/proline symporter
MIIAGTGFSGLDWLVLVGYFVGITVFGLWVARKIKTSGGYFLGDRKLPWWVMMGQAFGTGTNAENPVAQAGATCNMGFATIWYQWKNMLITPFYWLMSPWYRRSERTTIGEIIEDRYGRGLALLYTIFAIAFFVFNQGAMLKGAGKIISVATGGDMISPNGVVVAMTVTFILYSFFGGLISSAYTDFIQGFLIIILSFMLIPTGLHAVGGFAKMRSALPPDFFYLYSDVSGLDAWTIAMLALNGLIGITAQPHILSMNATGKTERAGRVGQTYGTMVKRFCTIGWALTGLIVAAMVFERGQQLPDSEHAFGYACRELLGPGMVGLMVSCVLAANMSTCSNFMVNTGALFTRNIYQLYVKPDANDRQLLNIGRLSGLGLTALGIWFALKVDRILDAFMFTETIAALMGIMFLGGLLWKRANRHGALAATLSAFMVYYALNYMITCAAPGPGAKEATFGAAWTQMVDACHDGHLRSFLDHGTVRLFYKWKAAPYGWATLAGFGSFILVSLLTRPEDPEKIERFFDKMRRTSDSDGLTEGQPRPLAAERGQDMILLDLPGWFTRERWRGFFRRYREDLTGFVWGWVTVAGLVLVAWGIMQIGK